MENLLDAMERLDGVKGEAYLIDAKAITKGSCMESWMQLP